MEPIDSLAQRLQMAMSTTMRRVQHEFTEGMDPSLTGPQFFILHLLSRKDRWKVTELAEKMCVKPSAITIMIDRLCHNQLVHRERDEKDRRVVFMCLTEQGEKILKEAEEKRNKILLNHLSQLEPEELESFVTLSEKLARIVLKDDNKE